MGRSKRRFYNRRKRKEIQYMQRIATLRIEYLCRTASAILTEQPERANRYISLARKIAMSTKTPLPSKYKNWICHGCKRLLRPGFNARVRLQPRKGQGSHRVLHCYDCGHITRHYYKTKKPVEENHVE